MYFEFNYCIVIQDVKYVFSLDKNMYSMFKIYFTSHAESKFYSCQLAVIELQKHMPFLNINSVVEYLKKNISVVTNTTYTSVYTNIDLDLDRKIFEDALKKNNINFYTEKINL